MKKRELFDKVKDKIPMSRELVKLRTDVPMTFDWAGWNLSDIDGSKLAELFRTWGFRSMEDQVRQLLPTTSRREAEPKKFETPPTSIPRPEPKGPPSLFDAIEDEPTETVPTTTVWRHDYRLVADDAAFTSFLAELRRRAVRRPGDDEPRSCTRPRSSASRSLGRPARPTISPSAARSANRR